MLSEENIFPPPHLANEEGILAVGGDLNPKRLLIGYASGIFPWYSASEPIIWWSPDPRFVLFPDQLRVSRSLNKVIKKDLFQITVDQAFSRVIKGCQNPRKNQPDTWITKEMYQAYLRLHQLGYAHSIEAWQEGQLAGGFYGVSLGRCFFGESMFTHVANASKVAFVHFVRQMQQWGFQLIDSQVYTEHLSHFGARNIERQQYLQLLNKALQYPALKGSWSSFFQPDFPDHF